MSRALTLGLLLALAAGLALRCPQLGVRPMHNDEGVNALKFRDLWLKGSYQYDPNEYHGPTLPYVTLPWVRLTGARDFVHLSEAQLRGLTVIFGIGLVLLLPLISDGLGRNATIGAAWFTAVSPAMVFYSRYYIHEMLLVFFTFLALGAGWRYTRKPTLGWALLAGAAVGFMAATKETFVITLASAGVAVVLNQVGDRVTGCGGEAAPFKWNPKHLFAALAVCLAVALILFSSFFTNRSGPLDAVRAYLPWLHRAGGASPHIHPWNFYFARLIYRHAGHGPVWSEALILALAVVGFVTAFIRGNSPAVGMANRKFIRFLAGYTLVLTLAYTLISYKTPWCLLSFWHGMILLAGVGGAALFNWLPGRLAKTAFGVGLLAGLANLTVQAWQASVEYPADRHNPYVYAQTVPDALKLVKQVDSLAHASPQGDRLLIKVMAPEAGYGPLPWYLRQFENVGWYSEIPADPAASIMIVSTQFQASLDRDHTHLMVGMFELRPQTFFELYVETNLWREYLAHHPPPAD